MIERGGGGKIINISSIAGIEGIARYAAYCSSKSAIISFSQCLALELATHNIHVNAVCPGLTETDRLYDMANGLRPADMTTEAYREEMIASSIEKNPLGRIGQPEDVANIVAFLASSESDYMTGLAVNVSGGALMH